MINAFILLCSMLVAQPQPKTNVYQADIQNSLVTWTGYAQTGAYAPSGTLKLKSGTIKLNNGALVGGAIIVDMNSLQHEKEQLQTHLKNADFFNVDHFPQASFVLTTARGKLITGKMTIKGITRVISFPFMLIEKDGLRRLEANVTIDRTLFGIKYNSASYFQDLGSYAIKNKFTLHIQLVTKD